MKTSTATASFLFVTFVAALGCGATPPPSELVEARSAQQTAIRGPASELALVQLDEARVALERAESSFEADGDSQATRDLAYIALRKAERAHAHAQSERAGQRMEEIRRQQEDLEAEYLRRTQRQLEVTQQQLEEERDRLQARDQELVQSQQQLQERSQALEQERAARERAEQQAAAALQSLREIAQVQEEQRGLVITLSGAVLFASGQSELLPIARQTLDQVAQTLKDQGNRPIVIEGHTDSRGSRSTNERLSLARAEAVRTHLISQGIDAARVRARGLGPDRPVADNNTAEGRANNRRVEIIVEPQR